ncbi:MAG TPA: hypothetical protein VFZ61_16635 [Polyangiales bacterium]
MLGQLKVYRRGADITHNRCTATFLDAEGAEKARVSLDASGWIFSAIAPGTTQLGGVECEGEDRLEYEAEQLQFEVAPYGKATYFGNLSIEFERSYKQPLIDWRAATRMAPFVGGALAALLAATPNAPPTYVATELRNVRLSDRLNDALATYRRRTRRRFPLPVVTALAAPATRGGPLLEARGDVVVSEHDLRGLRLTWLCSAKPPLRLALRLVHTATAPELADCGQLELQIDGQTLRLPLAYRAAASSDSVEESLQTELEPATLQRLADATNVQLRVCRLTRSLSYEAAFAGSRVLSVHAALVADEAKLAAPSNSGVEASRVVQSGAALPEQAASAPQ